MADSSHSHDAAPPAEPTTPLWVTLLGATLLTLGVLYFLVPSGDEEPRGEAVQAEKSPVPRP